MAREPCAGVWAPTWLSYFTMGMSVILLVITIGGNFLVCLAVIKDPYGKLRTPFMFMLVNLAITDLIVGGITLPTSVVTHSLEAVKTKKAYHVQIIHMTYFISCIASILNLMTLCVDRVCAVTWPLKYRCWLTFKVCVATSALIWIVAVGISMMYWVIGYTNLLFIYAHTALGVALTIAGGTFHISRKLRAQAKTRSETIASSMQLRLQDVVKQPLSTVGTLRTKAERNVTSLLLSILIMFIVCYAPAIIMMYVLKWCPTCDCKFRHVLRDFTFLFVASNSAVNPFVCAIRLRTFRHAVKAVFLAKKRIRSLTAMYSFSDNSKNDQHICTAISSLVCKNTALKPETIKIC